MLARRRARVVSEELREGSTLFSIHAYMPVQVWNELLPLLHCPMNKCAMAMCMEPDELIRQPPFWVDTLISFLLDAFLYSCI